MLKLLIEPTGEITAIYSDQLADLADQGHATIKRASNVEPDPRGGWTATMLETYPRGETAECVEGCQTLARFDMDCLHHRDVAIEIGPFRLRETALAAEVDYLEKQLGL